MPGLPRGFDVDLTDDEADRGRRRITCPTLVLWGGRGPLGAVPDVLDVWRAWAPAATGWSLPAGHHLAEERPDLVRDALRRVLTDPATSPSRSREHAAEQ